MTVPIEVCEGTDAGEPSPEFTIEQPGSSQFSSMDCQVRSFEHGALAELELGCSIFNTVYGFGFDQSWSEDAFSLDLAVGDLVHMRDSVYSGMKWFALYDEQDQLLLAALSGRSLTPRDQDRQPLDDIWGGLELELEPFDCSARACDRFGFPVSLIASFGDEEVVAPSNAIVSVGPYMLHTGQLRRAEDATGEPCPSGDDHVNILVGRVR